MAATLDQLPYVCLMKLCSCLSPEDLCRFSGVNKVFYDISCSESLWRDHSLNRWQFCNINQVSEGPQRWRRYFRARRRVENRMDTGRPTKDYRVKSLRGHKADIVAALCLNVSNDNLENPSPTLVLSLSKDQVLYAWDVVEGKPVWSLEDKQVSCVAGNDLSVAVGDGTGLVTVYSVSDWSELAKYAPTSQDRTVMLVEFITVTIKKKRYNCLLISYALDDNSGEITILDLSPQQGSSGTLASLTTNTPSGTVSVKGAWLAAAQEHSASEVYVWNLCDVIKEAPPLSPHVTLHLNNNSSRPLIWLKPGTLATCSTGLSNSFFVPGPIPIPGLIPLPPQPPGPIQILHPQPRRIPGPPLPIFPQPSSDLEVWDVLKHVEDSKKSSSQVYRVKHMYDSKEVKLSCLPHSVAYSNGVLIVGDQNGSVKVMDTSSGKCLQEFTDHKGPVTDIYADAYRVLTCSKDFSIRVYRWAREEGKKQSYKLQSRYTLLGGSVALKTHDGFSRILCQSGSCVGVAGDILKLYTFIHQLD